MIIKKNQENQDYQHNQDKPIDPDDPDDQDDYILWNTTAYEKSPNMKGHKTWNFTKLIKNNIKCQKNMKGHKIWSITNMKYNFWNVTQSTMSQTLKY